MACPPPPKAYMTSLPQGGKGGEGSLGQIESYICDVSHIEPQDSKRETSQMYDAIRRYGHHVALIHASRVSTAPSLAAKRRTKAARMTGRPSSTPLVATEYRTTPYCSAPIARRSSCARATRTSSGAERSLVGSSPW